MPSIVTPNHTQSAILSRRPAPSACAASTAVKLMAMCSDANAAIACGVAVAGSCRTAIRWSIRTACRCVTSDTGSPANRPGWA